MKKVKFEEHTIPEKVAAAFSPDIKVSWHSSFRVFIVKAVSEYGKLWERKRCGVNLGQLGKSFPPSLINRALKDFQAAYGGATIEYEVPDSCPHIDKLP